MEFLVIFRSKFSTTLRKVGGVEFYRRFPFSYLRFKLMGRIIEHSLFGKIELFPAIKISHMAMGCRDLGLGTFPGFRIRISRVTMFATDDPAAKVETKGGIVEQNDWRLRRRTR